MERMLKQLKEKAHHLETEAFALLIAFRDPRTPWCARLFMGLVLAHTFSPIDLIPDFIPILGYLDDLILIPAGIALALKMIPGEVMTEARQKAAQVMQQGKPVSRLGAALVISVWGIFIAGLILVIVRRIHK